MPVVQKFSESDKYLGEQDEQDLMQTLVYGYIDDVYKLIVEFIKEYNKYICGSCGENCNEYTYNEETDVDECNQCKII